MEQKLILASASPRRKELIEQMGLSPMIVKSRVEEKMTKDTPSSVVMELSRQKAEDVKLHLVEYLVMQGIEDLSAPQDLEPTKDEIWNPDQALVLGADTVVAVDGKILGKPRTHAEAADMIRSLHSLHTDAVLLTGDSRQTADWFAKRVGINEVHAELLPEEKVALIEKMQAEGRTVCMIGDGVNDAPALKTAGVGAAMGSMGSDIAVEAADIALMSDDLSQITYLKRLARETVKTIRFSITLSMCINFLAVTCSVLGLLTPTTGALVHNAGSCLVVLIAALLYDRKFEVTVQTSVGEMSAADV